ncbi:MAG: hypothetical protein ACYSX0_19370 [Planctomycetota bacterium]|jgi:hypothetical protein
MIIGLLLATQWPSERALPGQRANRRTHEGERRLDRLEAAVQTLSDRFAASNLSATEMGEVPGEGRVELVPSIFALARQPPDRESLGRLGADYADARAGGAATLKEFYNTVQRHFLFRSYRDVLHELGRPDAVTRTERGPGFHYRFQVPNTDQSAWLAIGFTDGVVFQVTWS